MKALSSGAVAAVVAASLLLTSCDSNEIKDISGTYSLARVNGRALPTPFDPNEPDTACVLLSATGGELRLMVAGDFEMVEEYDICFESELFGDIDSDGIEEYFGVYSLEGTVLTLSGVVVGSGNTRPDINATVDGDMISVRMIEEGDYTYTLGFER